MGKSHEVIVSERVPQRGPYSQAVRVGNMIYVAGQAGLDPATGRSRGRRSSCRRARLSRTCGRSWRTPAAGSIGW